MGTLDKRLLALALAVAGGLLVYTPVVWQVLWAVACVIASLISVLVARRRKTPTGDSEERF